MLNKNELMDVSDKELMDAKYDAMEMQLGFYLAAINSEINRRNSE